MTVFMGKLKPKRDAEGDDIPDEFEIEHSTLNPVTVKLSELDDALTLASDIGPGIWGISYDRIGAFALQGVKELATELAAVKAQLELLTHAQGKD